MSQEEADYFRAAAMCKDAQTVYTLSQEEADYFRAAICTAIEQTSVVQDPTCLCGIEACIYHKLLQTHKKLGAGTILVLKQVR